VDSIFFCLTDPLFELNNDHMQHSPQWGGTWTGAAISNPWYDYWLFDPGVAGVGTFELTYSINTCSDSAVAVVYPVNVSPNEYSLCSNEPPFLLDSLIAGIGTWSGNGIVDASAGLFDPEGTSGDFYVRWTNRSSCRDSVLMHVVAFEPATISGVSPAYCALDSTIQVSLTPDGGLFSGDLATTSFNPSDLAPNTYHLFYAYNNGSCSSEDSVLFTVYPPLILTLSASDSTICRGEGVVITADATGGLGAATYQYTWSNGALSINSIQANPNSNTWYSVSVNDACSPEQTDSVLIAVEPPIQPQVLLSDTVCFGEPAVLDVQMAQIDNYQIKWDTTITLTLQTTAGSSHELYILDLLNGCTFDSVVTVPSYPPVTAAFSINPNTSCLTSKEAQNVQMIDYSLNAVTGLWDFGNGQTLEYGLPVVPQTSYGGAGFYTVTLIVSNNGGCSDTATATVCVLPPTPVFIPEAFSPNGDGNNDIFMVRGSGIIGFECSIYNRWGQRVFRSARQEDGWDGNVLGQPAQPGNYLYDIKIRLNDGSQLDKRGEIALVR
jgi:gliding motility-associated-like protein